MNLTTVRLRQVSPALPAILAFCLSVASPGRAEAYSILTIRDFAQSVGASSLYTRSNTSAPGSSSTTTEREFTEDYGASFDYSVLNPLLLKGTTSLDLEWLQDSSSGDGSSRKNSDFKLRYNVLAMILSRNSTPVTVSAFSSRQTVSQTFAPSYNNQTASLTAQLAALNLFIPCTLSYTQQSQETSGLSQNFRQNTSAFSAGVSPVLGRFGSLSLGGTLSRNDSRVQGSDQTSHSNTASAHAGYQSNWKSSQGLSRSLSVSYSYNAAEGVSTLNSQSLDGSLNWQLGKVLEGALVGYTNKSSSELFSTQTRGGGVSLSHRLLDTVTTGLRFSVNDEKFDSGENRAYNGGGSLAYGKLLPEESNLSLAYSYNLSRNERTGDVSEIEIVNESHALPNDTILNRIALNHPSFDPASIRVVGAQTLLSYPASFFNVVTEGIELLSFFAGDTAVLISYNYRQDPAVTTLSSSHNISAALDLYKNKYRLFANALLTDQHLVHGEATQLTLTNTYHYVGGVTAHLNAHTLEAELGYDKNYAEDRYHLSTSWAHAFPYSGGDLSLNAIDRYSWQNTSQGSGLWINSFSLLGNYRRPIGFVAGLFKANYSNVLVEGGALSQNVNLSANLEGKLGKFLALLTLNATWSFASPATSNSQGIGASLRRVF